MAEIYWASCAIAVAVTNLVLRALKATRWAPRYRLNIGMQNFSLWASLAFLLAGLILSAIAQLRPHGDSSSHEVRDLVFVLFVLAQGNFSILKLFAAQLPMNHLQEDLLMRQTASYNRPAAMTRVEPRSLNNNNSQDLRATVDSIYISLEPAIISAFANRNGGAITRHKDESSINNV